jgi:addiction module HigA family antidote
MTELDIGPEVLEGVREIKAFKRAEIQGLQTREERLPIACEELPNYRPPTHPGEMLREEFLTPLNLTQRELAEAIHVPYQRINEIINGKRGVTPATALRLARFFGMSAGFWMNLQLRWDLYHAQQPEAEVLAVIQPYTV